MAETQTTGGKTLQCVVVTPERAVLDEPAEFIAIPMFDGELGVAAGRQAMIGRLGIGELRVKNGNHVKRLFLDGGFAQVRGNTVTILTPSALEEGEIKPDAVREALTQAQALVPKADDEFDRKMKELARARGKLRLATRGQSPAPH